MRAIKAWGPTEGVRNSGQLVTTKTVIFSAHSRKQIAVPDEFTNHANIGYIIFDTNSPSVQGSQRFT